MQQETDVESGHAGRDLLGLAAGAALIALGVLAAAAVHDAWQAAADARAIYQTQAAVDWYTGDGSPTSRGEIDWSATGHAALCAGGLVVTGLYGVRLCLRVLVRAAR